MASQKRITLSVADALKLSESLAVALRKTFTPEAPLSVFVADLRDPPALRMAKAVEECGDPWGMGSTGTRAKDAIPLFVRILPAVDLEVLLAVLDGKVPPVGAHDVHRRGFYERQARETPELVSEDEVLLVICTGGKIEARTLSTDGTMQWVDLVGGGNDAVHP